MSSSVHADNKKNDILIFGEGPTQGLDGTTLFAEKKVFDWFFPNLEKKFVSAYIIMEQIVFYLLMVKKFLNSKQKMLKL